MADLPTAPPQANQVKPNYVIYRMVIGDESPGDLVLIRLLKKVQRVLHIPSLKSVWSLMNSSERALLISFRKHLTGP